MVFTSDTPERFAQDDDYMIEQSAALARWDITEDKDTPTRASSGNQRRTLRTDAAHDGFPEPLSTPFQ